MVETQQNTWLSSLNARGARVRLAFSNDRYHFLLFQVDLMKVVKMTSSAVVKTYDSLTVKIGLSDTWWPSLTVKSGHRERKSSPTVSLRPNFYICMKIYKVYNKLYKIHYNLHNISQFLVIFRPKLKSDTFSCSTIGWFHLKKLLSLQTT